MKASKKTRTGETVKELFAYMRPYSASVAGTLILCIVFSAASLYIPVLIGKAIDNIIAENRVDFDSVLRTLIIIGALVATAALAQWIMSVLNNRIAFGMVKDIRSKAFRRLQKLPLSYIDTHGHGDIVSRIIADSDQLAEGLLLGFTQLFSGALAIIGTLAFMIMIDARITAVVVLLTPLSLVVASFIAKRTHSMFTAQAEIRAEQTILIDEAVGEQKVVRAFGHEGATLARFDEINERLRSCSLKAIFFSSLVNPSTRFINAIIYAAIGLTGAFAAADGALSVGALASFLSYATQYAKPFNEISGVITEFQNALACAKRVFDLIGQPIEKPDPVIPERLESVRGSVELNHVCFSYSKERRLIHDFNLSVRSGQRIAIVGPTGCGKTTLINLLMRFYDVDSGTISIDGVETRDVTRRDLRSCFGMVLQETWLQTGTIRDNIAFGRREATNEEIIAAAKAANAHGFIMQLPNGYDTEIDESGGTISQGQRQLLCIARVMLCIPPMLILDEATSSIDTRTEIRIQNALTSMMHGRTSFIVAHRLSTIREADMILVMRDGSIIEQGTHRELLARNGFYATLYRSQFAH